MFRYMTLIWNHGNTQEAETVELISRRLRSLSKEWQEALVTPGMRTFLAGPRSGALTGHLLSNESGIVLGSLFARSRAPDSDAECTTPALGVRETDLLVESRGAWLVQHTWGNYVAFVADRHARAKYIVKDPCGSLPCYFAVFRGIVIVFSCLSDCVGLRLLPLTINPSYLRRHLIDGGSGFSQHPIEEIRQVFRGECVEVVPGSGDPRISRQLYWTPTRFSGAEDLIEDPKAAATAMRNVVLSSTRSLARAHRSVLLRLSGGLDSSIISGCMKGLAETAVKCQTYFNPRGRSDERPWARMAAEHAGFKLIECPVVPEAVDLATVFSMPASVQPMPVLGHLQRSADTESGLLGEGESAIFTGDGGDSGFCSDSVRYALAEYFHLHRRFNSYSMRLASSIALLRGRSTWAVLLDSLSHWRSGARGLLVPMETLLKICHTVSPDIVAAYTQSADDHHPWFRNLGRIPCGLAQRLGMALGPYDFYNVSADSAASAPETISPLYSQPVMELLLRIPIHAHFENGRDRGLARRAFQGYAPDKILQRHWKDRAPGFHDEMIHRHRPLLREIFLDGVLISQGFLSKSAIETALSDAPTKSQVLSGELFNHLATEMWIRRLSGFSEQQAAA